ncbi:PREDICTED: probable WRKY transcription factor 70 [Ipomoea nil]|uniref:probable WRKY transcription factor 70 n=1 Tax=Ipomoea nil TaxID=35883 RepID=UPI0009017297|nr:PREDICTED: probable WRKY transcription factor 70 [Ipomoea nil]
MQSPSPENMAGDWKRAIGELIRGQKLTKQLWDLLKNPPGDDGKPKVADDLLLQILGTFDKSLWILKSSIDTADEVSQGGAGAPSSPCYDGRRSEDSSGSCKTFVKDRRGCYKRRKTCESQIKESPNLVDDGHAWRKYGQKVILNSKYPRNYFRCTHKFDQDCQATKQVQRMEDDPPLYRTTYLGKHTCRNLQKCPQIFQQPEDASVILCFGQNSKSDMYTCLPTFSSSIKHENNPHGSRIGSSTSDCFVPSDDRLGSPYDTAGHVAPLSSASDYGEVISSGGTMDMSQFIGSDVVDDIDDFLII